MYRRQRREKKNIINSGSFMLIKINGHSHSNYLLLPGINLSTYVPVDKPDLEEKSTPHGTLVRD